MRSSAFRWGPPMRLRCVSESSTSGRTRRGCSSRAPSVAVSMRSNAEVAPFARRRDRAARRRLAVHVAAAAKAVRGMAGAGRRRRVASLDVFLTAPGRRRRTPPSSSPRCRGRQASRHSAREEEGARSPTAARSSPQTSLFRRGSPSATSAAHRQRSPSGIRTVTPTRSSPSISAGPAQRARLGHALRGHRTHSHASTCRRSRRFSQSAVARARRADFVGAELGETEWPRRCRSFETTSPREVARRFGVDRSRAEILPAGVILLAEVQRRLGVPLHVCGGGIREGAVLASLDALAA